MDNTLTGRERSDLNLESGLKTYAKTSFAFVSMANLVYAASYIVLVTAEIYLGGSMGLSISSVVTGWALLQVVLLGILVAFKSRRVLRSVGLVLPRSLPKFILCSLLMAAIVVLLGNVVLTNNPSRFIYGLKIVAVVVVGGASYFVALTAVDTRTRGLAQSFLKLVRPTKQV